MNERFRGFAIGGQESNERVEDRVGGLESDRDS